MPARKPVSRKPPSSKPRPLQALAFNCSLKGAREKEKSSTQALLEQVVDALGEHNVESQIVRAVDHNIMPGVEENEGRDDAWPDLQKRILAADILVIGTPIWLGQPSSVCKRVLERLDNVIHDLDDHGRMKTYNRVALVAVVGNEDGAHHVSAEIYQALNDCGFTIPAAGMTYWVGEAMGDKDYKDVLRTPRKVKEATALAAANAAHLAALLSEKNYPGMK